MCFLFDLTLDRLLITGAQVMPSKVLVSAALLRHVGAAGDRTCWESADGVVLRLDILESMMCTHSS